MYKLLLCWRYLRTRWIALASIISVLLGVATMIVVNSVMEGFAVEMQGRIHGILSDVIVDARSFEGMRDPKWHEEQIRKAIGDDVAGITPTVSVPGMLSFRHGARTMMSPVQLIGIDAKTQSSVSDFGRYLQHPENRRAMSFDLRQGGYDTHDSQAGPETPERRSARDWGWTRRLEQARLRAFEKRFAPPSETAPAAPTASAAAAQPIEVDGPPPPQSDPFAKYAPPTAENTFNPEKQQHTGIVLGILLASRRLHNGEDVFFVAPGDDVTVTTANNGQPPKFVPEEFTITDLYESKMSEYDANFVFMPIEKLQKMRNMIEPNTGIGWVNSMQIKLKPGVDGNAVRDKLEQVFNPDLYVVSTWRDKQGPLLAAVQMETAILNILLSFIIAVAGFGILAIFYMIVVEKTRDIGILKSLGASNRGVMGIFLSYGLSLGIVGSGVGLVIGLLFVRYINEIADGLGKLTGRPVFDPSIYYFYKIPTIVEPLTVAWIVVGALGIAILASVLPARRAARLHPVEALRYE